MDVSDPALLVLRSWVGVVMLAHGANHARSLDRTARWFSRVGWRASRYQGWLLSAIEIAIGIGLVLGLMTTPAASGMVAVVLVAFHTQHRPNGFFTFNKGEGYEYVITLAAAGAALALLGAGGWSLDRVFDINPSDANRGQILLAVFVLGIVHVAAFWRPERTRKRTASG